MSFKARAAGDDVNTRDVRWTNMWTGRSSAGWCSAGAPLSNEKRGLAQIYYDIRL